jgi:prepilin-type N-terminal cleavage/methylation domain-containing protein/prepilin-type processing-associated H-X9-DG protein
MNSDRDQHWGFTIIELLVVIAIVLVLASVAAPAVWGAYKSSSLAVSANNIRQLSAGGMAYLGDNNHRFWPFLRTNSEGQVWWFGLEPSAHKGKPEGERMIEMDRGALGSYMPRNMVPDPSFGFTGKPFKPKYKFGYIGVGYNVVLANGWQTFDRRGARQPLRYWDLTNPAQTVVFATSAQVYPFKDEFIEEFYGIDQREVTVHFRHGSNAMVSFADGSAGFLPMDPSTRDNRAPEANIGRFAPRGSFKYLR